MTRETVTLRSAEGAESEGTAEVVRPSGVRRAIVATVFVVGGIVGGLAFIIIPIVHLFTTWALPLIGVLMAIRVMRRELSIHRLDGVCPACRNEIHEYDRGGDDPAWQLCPRCDARLAIVLAAVTIR